MEKEWSYQAEVCGGLMCANKRMQRLETLSCLATNCETISNWRNPGILQNLLNHSLTEKTSYRMKKFKFQVQVCKNVQNLKCIRYTAVIRIS